MKTRLLLSMIAALTLLLMACSGGNVQVVEQAQPEKKSEEAAGEEIDSVDLGEITSQGQDEGQDEELEVTEDPLASYPSDKVEYARVWLQVIGNHEVGELNVQHLSAGEQLNPYDDTSVAYPEDVIVLSGKASADGMVTYSGNGDGTINVYDVPSHWPTSGQIEESMEEYTQKIVDGAEKVSIDVGKDEEVAELIEKING
ncbi:hypothetical protein CN378_18250 [Bacillus sp. AFS015802]|uniref:hypothetical protein n=1 Tax=Bacillus sp. AFS015802 TaxID=2033486 RepID=UPI000BF80765|nr:hypothetical protein [Bacillus sp. AFS015802]PFA62982.1 hypothetical protein CN378_18250 [Bacillus sp. AFS015802]